jgi:hypothetical protein
LKWRRAQKNRCCGRCRGQTAVPYEGVCETLGVTRSNVAERSKEANGQRIGRPPKPDGELVAGIEAVIKTLPTYGYRRVHAVLRRKPAPRERRRPTTSGSIAS